MAKPAKLVSSKTLSSPAGVKDVSFGKSTPERRQRQDFSKSGISEVDHSKYDDHKDRMKRWGSIF